MNRYVLRVLGGVVAGIAACLWLVVPGLAAAEQSAGAQWTAGYPGYGAVVDMPNSNSANGNYVTQLLTVATGGSSGTCSGTGYITAGISHGWQGANSGALYLFWGDARPSDQTYYQHQISASAHWNTAYNFNLTRSSGTSSWYVWEGGSHVGSSSPQPNAGNCAATGSTTGDVQVINGFYGTSTSLQYESTQSPVTWVNKWLSPSPTLAWDDPYSLDWGTFGYALHEALTQ